MTLYCFSFIYFLLSLYNIFYLFYLEIQIQLPPENLKSQFSILLKLILRIVLRNHVYLRFFKCFCFE